MIKQNIDKNNWHGENKNTPYRYNRLLNKQKRIPFYEPTRLRDEMLSLYQANEDICNLSKSQLERLQICGKLYYTDFETGEKKYNKCNLSICPICSRRKALFKKDTNAEIDNHVSRMQYVTQMYTIAFNDNVSNDNISRQIDILIKVCTKLFNQRPYKKYAIGSMRALEISVADTGLYHPHIHLLVMCEDNSLDLLSKLIKKSFNNFDVFTSQPFDAVKTEVFTRYVFKLNDSKVLSAQEMHDIKTATKGKQLLTYTGFFRELKNIIIKKSSE